MSDLKEHIILYGWVYGQYKKSNNIIFKDKLEPTKENKGFSGRFNKYFHNFPKLIKDDYIESLIKMVDTLI